LKGNGDTATLHGSNHLSRNRILSRSSCHSCRSWLGSGVAIYEMHCFGGVELAVEVERQSICGREADSGSGICLSVCDPVIREKSDGGLALGDVIGPGLVTLSVRRLGTARRGLPLLIVYCSLYRAHSSLHFQHFSSLGRINTNKCFVNCGLA